MRRILYTDDPAQKDAQRQQGTKIINVGFLILAIVSFLIVLAVLVASVG